jgi:hypothetical protein
LNRCGIVNPKYKYEFCANYFLWYALEHGKMVFPLSPIRENIIGVCQTSILRKQHAKIMIIECVMDTIAETMNPSEADELLVACGIRPGNDFGKLLLLYIIKRRGLDDKKIEMKTEIIRTHLITQPETKIIKPFVLSLDEPETPKQYHYTVVLEGREDQHLTYTDNDFGTNPFFIDHLTIGVSVIFHKDGRYEVI